MPAWLAALIVAVVYGIIAFVLVKQGQARIKAGGPAGARADHRDGEGGRGMGQDPDAIRQDIEQTRAEMSETVEARRLQGGCALAGQGSGERQGGERQVQGERYRHPRQGGRDRRHRPGRRGDPSRGEVKQTTRQAAGIARENPLGLAIGAAAIGFLAGLAVPSTRVEDEKLGPVADQVKDKVKETGQEALDRGKQVAQEVASTATETARQSAQEHGQELAQSAKQNTQDVQSEANQAIRP